MHRFRFRLVLMRVNSKDYRYNLFPVCILFIRVQQSQIVGEMIFIILRQRFLIRRTHLKCAIFHFLFPNLIETLAFLKDANSFHSLRTA